VHFLREFGQYTSGYELEVDDYLDQLHLAIEHIAMEKLRLQRSTLIVLHESASSKSGKVVFLSLQRAENHKGTVEMNDQSNVRFAVLSIVLLRRHAAHRLQVRIKRPSKRSCSVKIHCGKPSVERRRSGASYDRFPQCVLGDLRLRNHTRNCSALVRNIQRTWDGSKQDEASPTRSRYKLCLDFNLPRSALFNAD